MTSVEEFIYDKSFAKSELKNKILRKFLPTLSKINMFLRYRTIGFGKVEIETSSICNRRCKFCPVSKYPREPALMDDRVFRKVIDELAEMKFHGILSPHLFNEPLLDQRIEEFVKYIRQKLPNVKIKIFTNGDLLTRKKFDSLVSAGVDEFCVTQYDEQMPEVVKNLFSSLTNKEKKLIKYRILNENSLLLNRGGLVDIKRPMQKLICSPNFFMVNYKGDAVLCSSDYFGSVVFGNVKNERIMDIWNKPYYKKVRGELEKGVFNLDICKKCVGMGE